MTESVTTQEAAAPEQKEVSNKEFNFRRLEEERRKAQEEAKRQAEEKELLRKELAEIKEYLKPKEKDPFDDSDDILDPEVKQRIEAKLAKERNQMRKEAQEIANKTYEEIENKRKQAKEADFLSKLKNEFPDFDEVMSEKSLIDLQEKDPDFLETCLEIPDDYKRRKAAYKRIKQLKSKEEEKPTIQDKVDKNQRNPYFIPSSMSGTTTAIEFDLNTKEARDSAYKALKDAQKGKR